MARTHLDNARPPTRLLRALSFLSVPAIGLAAAPASAGGGHGHGHGHDCKQVSFSVTLSPASATRYSVAGRLCRPRGQHASTIQVLLHGSTYSRAYWDLPGAPRRYSYVDAATEAGYATLNLDRIGVGLSDRPPAAEVTVEANAFVAHQIVTALRGGACGGDGPIDAERVVLVGHSLGSSIAALEAATYADVDGVILSGILHNAGPELAGFGALLHPAQLDPRTVGAPPDYFTTLPGARPAFYALADAAPSIIAKDEATKQTVTAAELATFGDGLGVTADIHVPVLVAVGDNDLLFCSAPACSASGTLAAEPAFYAPDSGVETYALPGAGHSINLHENASQWFDVANDWVARRVD
jgi:pimeloyl-ACP methyl ester carboxylesterase